MHASHGSGELATMPHVIQRYWQACPNTLKKYAHAGIYWQACYTWSWRICKHATHGPG